MFGKLIREYVPNSSDLIINFEDNIDYKPDDDEVFLISDFNIQDILINCARQPLAVEILDEDDYEYIKYIFISDIRDGNVKLAFTVFDKKKIIHPTSRWYILHSGDTFRKLDKKAIALDSRIDALYYNGNLYFRSLYMIKRIFKEEINEYYREATDNEVETFNNTFFKEDIPEEYIDSRSRKLIFGIVKSGVSYNLPEIIKIGKKFGLSVELDEESGKLIVPQSKREFKKLLKFLNDDLLESPLTQAKYETNSKRRIA